MKTRADGPVAPGVAAALASAVLLGAAAFDARADGEIVKLRFDGEGRFRHAEALAPGRFVEVCGVLQPGQPALRWRFEAAAPLDFNIHHHVGRDVVYPVQRGATRGEAGTLTAAQSPEPCWMWTNKGTAPVALGVEILR